ncbi:MAG: PGPGW domain-containing protein [Microthrixaceae bacterium]|nr:PGPGW domain-containing protein [Microthrixaceae bacterium]
MNRGKDPADRESLAHRLREAAEEAERQTGRREETPEELRRGLSRELLRAVLGVVVIIVGVAALPLPGPGWLIIIVGLNLLPFAWAERTVRLIRRRVPGVPEEGNVPAHMWIIMAALTALVTIGSILWGDNISEWARDLI